MAESTPAPGFGLKLHSNSRNALALAIGFAGTMMVHHPMIISGFRRIQTDLGDTRLIHYLLEHGYLWVRRGPLHLEFWSPPFFYPVKNVAAYSDVLVGFGPVYWLWRASGASPDLAFGLWMISMSVLNYAAGLLLFRRGFRFGIPAAVAGAALVAFGAPRVNQTESPATAAVFLSIAGVVRAIAAIRRRAPEAFRCGLATGCWQLRRWWRSSTRRFTPPGSR